MTYTPGQIDEIIIHQHTIIYRNNKPFPVWDEEGEPC